MHNSIFSGSLAPVAKGFATKASRRFSLEFEIFDFYAHGIISAAQWHQDLGYHPFIISFFI